MRIVHCSFTPCAGAIEALSSAIRDYTDHDSRWISCGGRIGTLLFHEDVKWEQTAQFPLLARADVIVLHNYLSHNTEPLFDYFEGDPSKKCVGVFHTHPGGIGQGNELAEAGFPHFAVAQYQALLFPKAIPLRNTIRFDRSDWPDRRERDDGRVRIGYSPSTLETQTGKTPKSAEWYHCKGADVTIPVLDAVCKKNPEAEYVVIRDVPCDMALSLKSECDILIDEVVTGSYHRSTLEGLAFGVPTVVNIEPDVHGVMVRAADGNDVPVVHATCETLEERLSWLVTMDVKKRRRMGTQSRDWMVRHWHPRDIARGFCDALESFPSYGEVMSSMRGGGDTK